MDIFTKVTELDIKRYNYWVNFEVLPRLILDYNEKRKSVEDLLNSVHYSDGSKVYNKLRKRMQIKKNYSDKNPDKILILVSTPSNDHLTSSTRTPKFVGEEFCDALVAFHGHGFGKSLAAFWQSEDDCGDCLCHVEYLVDAHADVGRL